VPRGLIKKRSEPGKFQFVAYEFVARFRGKPLFANVSATRHGVLLEMCSQR
jgi:hypothetical protein